MKVALAVGLVVVGFLALRGGSKADAVVECLEKTGATTKENPDFARVFPYLIAVGTNASVESFPELEGATVYGVAYGEGEAVLFAGEEEEDTRAFERTLVNLGAMEGVDVPTRRAGSVVLIWTVPLELSLSAPLDNCLE